MNAGAWVPWGLSLAPGEWHQQPYRAACFLPTNVPLQRLYSPYGTYGGGEARPNPPSPSPSSDGEVRAFVTPSL